MMQMLNAEETNAKTIFHIFDHTIKPILLYSSEIWGTFDTSLRRLKNATDKPAKGFENLKAETLHLKLCRYILGVHPRTSILAIRGETGRIPLYHSIIINVLKFMQRLQCGNCSDLLKDALLCSKQLFEEGAQSWYTSATFLATSINLDPQLLKTDSAIGMQSVRKNLYNKFCNTWKTEVSAELSVHGQTNKLRTYNKFKGHFGMEAYIESIRNRKFRQAMARFRTSAHKLRIESGRYEKPKLESHLRTCEVCKSDIVEDEMHFLTGCQMYYELRNRLYHEINKENINFKRLNDHDKFVWLMSNENPRVLMQIGMYIHKCFELRSTLLITT